MKNDEAKKCQHLLRIVPCVDHSASGMLHILQNHIFGSIGGGSQSPGANFDPRKLFAVVSDNACAKSLLGELFINR
jgi:hypothetical protein